MFFQALALVGAGTVPAPGTESVSPAEAPGAPRCGHGRKRLPSNLPRKRVVYDVRRNSGIPALPETLQHIGEEVSEPGRICAGPPSRDPEGVSE